MSKPRGLSAETKQSADAPVRPVLEAQRRGRPDKKDYSMTFFIPRPTYEWMKKVAVERGTSLQQLVAEATDAWLAKNGGPPFKP